MFSYRVCFVCSVLCVSFPSYPSVLWFEIWKKLKYEDNLQYENDLKYEDDLKNEDNLKYDETLICDADLKPDKQAYHTITTDQICQTKLT